MKPTKTFSITKTLVPKRKNLSDVRLNKAGTIGTEPIAKKTKNGYRKYTEVKLGKLGKVSIPGKRIK